MKTPFTVHFNKADIPLRAVATPPFVPRCPMLFVPSDRWMSFTGPGCDLIFREHDGYNIYVAVLEARLGDSRNTLTLAAESLTHDLHLVYQLAGTTDLSGLALQAGHHTQIYAPPAHGEISINVDPHTQRYTACTIIPKGNWVSRDIEAPKNPLFQLILCLKGHHHQSRHLPSTAMSPQVRAWVSLLLTAPQSPHLLMDNALSHPLGNLLDIHLHECGKQELRDATVRQNSALVDGARTLVVELLARLKDGELPQLGYISGKLGTDPATIRRLHYAAYGQKFSHYLIYCRIEEAKKRLLQGDPIGSIAFSLGWTDDSHFIKQFKKYTGVTPGQFGKNL